MPAIPSSVESALSLIKSDLSKVLSVDIGGRGVTPGEHIAKADAHKLPQVGFASAKSDQTYIAICLDVDAPFVSLPLLSPILHWIQPGLKLGTGGAKTLTSEVPFVSDYIGPGPPPGSGPHRYVFMLYEQPEGFAGTKFAPAGGAKMGRWPRMRYDLDAFEKQAGLGSVLAANYFLSN